MPHHDKRHDQKQHIQRHRDGTQRVSGLDDLHGIAARAGDAGVEARPREGDGRTLHHCVHAGHGADGQIGDNGAPQHPFLHARGGPLQESHGDAGLHDGGEEEVEELEEEDPLEAVGDVLHARGQHADGVLAEAILRAQHQEGDEGAEG